MKCPYCQSENTNKFFEGSMPNILSACGEETLKNVRILPIEVKLCRDCMLGFNSSRLDDDQLKTIYDDYLYLSPIHGIGATDFEGMIKTLEEYFAHEDEAVEIGCSDGYLLKELKNRGYKNLMGIEPGPQADEAKALGLNVMKAYFDENTFQEKKVDGIFLSHVFEHFGDPFGILKSMKKSLNANGKIVIEVPYFTGFHHQHLFFYNYSFFKRICDDTGLKIVKVELEKGAIRVVFVHGENLKYKEVIFSETKQDVINKAATIYSDFEGNVKRISRLLSDYAGKSVCWWGAGSTSVIYLNQLEKGLVEEAGMALVDGDDGKHGKFIPGLNLKVESYKTMRNKEIDLLIIASTFFNEIKVTMDKEGIVARQIEII